MPVPLSIVVPAYNEARRLPDTCAALLSFLDEAAPGGELVVVDDGSRDGTAELLARLERSTPAVRVLSSPRNLGKGAALRRGVLASRGAIVQLHDADLSYPLEAITEARARIEASAQLLLGARDLAQVDSRHSYGPARRLGTLGFNLFVELALGLGVPDTQCGFKQLRGAVARALFGAMREDGFAFDVELIALARAWDLRVERLPLSMTVAAGSSVRIVRDSLAMARDVLGVRRRLRRGHYPPRPPALG